MPKRKRSGEKMQRYFVSLENWSEETVLLKNEDVHHVTRVMRNNVADKVICIHPNGSFAICVIRLIEKEQITLSILEWIETNYELPIEVTIVQGLPKGTKLDLILQKSTELGATAIQLLQADRSITKWDHRKSNSKIIRYEKILKEASEQSYRNLIPKLLVPEKLEVLLESATEFDYIFFAYEEEAKSLQFNSFAKALHKITPGNKIAIFIGPEGGFSKEEVSLLKSFNCQPIRLGKRILRTETASLYALSAISYHFEESLEM